MGWLPGIGRKARSYLDDQIKWHVQTLHDDMQVLRDDLDAKLREATGAKGLDVRCTIWLGGCRCEVLAIALTAEKYVPAGVGAILGAAPPQFSSALRDGLTTRPGTEAGVRSAGADGWDRSGGPIGLSGARGPFLIL